MEKVLGISNRICGFLGAVVKYCSIAILSVLMCAVFTQVVVRAVTGDSIIQIEEFSLVSASWLAFFTIAYSTHRNVHVRISIIPEKFPVRIQHMIDMCINGATFVASLYLIRFGFRLALKKFHVPMNVLPTNQGFWYISFPIGMFFTSCFLFNSFLGEMQMVRDLGSKDESEENK